MAKENLADLRRFISNLKPEQAEIERHTFH
jgi:hypothetical protein